MCLAGGNGGIHGDLVGLEDVKRVWARSRNTYIVVQISMALEVPVRGFSIFHRGEDLGDEAGRGGGGHVLIINHECHFRCVW